VSSRSIATLEPIAAGLHEHGTRVEAVAADMMDEAQVSALAAVHNERFGSLGVLVLCAGTGTAGPLASYPISRLDKQFAVNVRAPLLLVQQLLPALRAAASNSDRGAKIIAIASITGMAAELGLAAYGALQSGADLAVRVDHDLRRRQRRYGHRDLTRLCRHRYVRLGARSD
jgi:3-oxoacyl-[acyl-carrier protein] reductase